MNDHTNTPLKLKARLVEQVAKDKAHPSRCTLDPTDPSVILVKVSGTACGLAVAIEHQTGEDFDAIMAEAFGTINTLNPGEAPNLPLPSATGGTRA